VAVESAPGEALAALVPTWRRDVAIEADVAEEIARVRGYELVPSVTPDTSMPAFRPSPLEVRELVRETLAGAGLTEVVTTALVSPRHVETLALRRRCRRPATTRSPVARRSP
jgi:phenylalanyl-tRNA synthetase beta chain